MSWTKIKVHYFRSPKGIRNKKKENVEEEEQEEGKEEKEEDIA